MSEITTRTQKENWTALEEGEVSIGVRALVGECGWWGEGEEVGKSLESTLSQSIND